MIFFIKRFCLALAVYAFSLGAKGVSNSCPESIDEIMGVVSVPVADLVSPLVSFTLEEALVVEKARLSIPELFGDRFAYRRTQLLYGERVVVLEVRDGWCRVRAQGQLVVDDQGVRGCHGWIRASNLCMDNAFCGSFGDSKRPIVITSLMASVYEKKSCKSPILANFFLGTELCGVLEQGWFRVSLIGGKIGFVLSSDCCDTSKITSIDEAFLRNKIILQARHFINHQYSWGGRKPYGVDCSSLTQLAYLSVGKIIPRYAHGQWLVAKKIVPSSAKPGDLVFLAANRDEKLVVVHVMIYAGNDELIEANGLAGCVQSVSSVERFGRPLSKLRNGDEICLRRTLFCGSFF